MSLRVCPELRVRRPSSFYVLREMESGKDLRRGSYLEYMGRVLPLL